MASYVKPGVDPKDLKGSKTEQNLHTALSGESQAYLRDQWFEEKAKADGFEDVARLFEATAANEKAHAELWFRYLGGYSATEKNLDAAASGEHFEWESMYADFAKEAHEEGFEALARMFERVASIEKHHEQNYRNAMQQLKDGSVFADTNPETKWICLNCGFVVSGKEPPAICPVCAQSKGYFARKKQG